MDLDLLVERVNAFVASRCFAQWCATNYERNKNVLKMLLYFISSSRQCICMYDTHVSERLYKYGNTMMVRNIMERLFSCIRRL